MTVFCLALLCVLPVSRPLIPGFAVVLSYAVAISYVSADAVSKGYTCAKESDSK